MTRRRKIPLFIGLTILLLCAGLYASNGYFRAAAFVIQAAGMQGPARSAARLEISAFDESALTVPWRGGQLRGRLYRPRGASDRAMLLVPGVHAAGARHSSTCARSPRPWPPLVDMTRRSP